MPITATFNVADMTAEHYDQVMADLSAKGLAKPAGRRFHVAWASQDGWTVVDVWDSPDQLQAFAETLMPLLAGVGVTPPEPQMQEVHNVVDGVADR